MEFSGMLLMFMLGLRHGFDPDHIALIDGVSVRYTVAKSSLAKWTGTLFALGHGAVVTSIAVMLSRFSHAWNFPAAVWNVLDWVPGLLLLAVGLMNMRMLLAKKRYRPTGLKTFFIPAKLKASSHPLAVVAIGILFAMVFDTNTQAAAWAYAATSQLSTVTALFLGLSFSIGMIITDTLDSRILYQLMLQSVTNDSVLQYRRRIGWIIVFISFITGGYKLFQNLMPSKALSDRTLTLVGISFFILLSLFYAYVWFTASHQSKKHNPWPLKTSQL